MSPSMSPAARMSRLGWKAIVLAMASSLISSGVSRIFGVLGSSAASSCNPHKQRHITAFYPSSHSLSWIYIKTDSDKWWTFNARYCITKTRTCSHESSCSVGDAIFVVGGVNSHFRLLESARTAGVALTQENISNNNLVFLTIGLQEDIYNQNDLFKCRTYSRGLYSYASIFKNYNNCVVCVCNNI